MTLHGDVPAHSLRQTACILLCLDVDDFEALRGARVSVERHCVPPHHGVVNAGIV
jgi:hypothetical protein